jgi:lipoprotein-anchoring transpeptidase ErfK/SrfK
MIPRKTFSRTALLAALAIGTAISNAPAFAASSDQIFFLWGGEEEQGGKRHVVAFSPRYTAGQIVVSFGDRRLYYVTRPGRAISYPIAIPRDQSRWEGITTVSMKRENPSWTPTPEMLRENPRLPSWVPGGHPMNPLGVRALYLGSSTYRIHGTDAPWTIGQAVSKGCIRMYNEDVLDLYPRVNIGAKVTVTWQTFRATPVAADDVQDEPVEKPRTKGQRAQSASYSSHQ